MWDLKSLVVPVWVKPAAALVVCASLLFGGWTVRGWHDSSKALKQTQADKQAVLDAIEKNRKDNAAENEKTRKLIGKPVAPTINRVISENPSPCRVPAPVHRGLSDGVDQGNAAIRDAGSLP